MSSIEPPWPLDELARIDKLKGYRVLDTPPDPVFDRLTQLGARHFGTPIALVSLVDEARQWFKSRCRLTLPSTPRRMSFCAYAILDDAVMVVPDTALDERFMGNELVTGAPYIRFYAGAPLKTPEGLRLGTFCVIDYKPRHDFDQQNRQDLEEFARIVIHELEMQSAQRAEQAALRAAEHAEARLRAIVDTAMDAIVVIDEHGIIRSFNTAAERMFGYKEDEAVGRNVRLLMPEPYRSVHDGYIRHYLRTGEPRIIGIGRELEGLRKDGSIFQLGISIAEWSVDGERFFTAILRDGTARKEAERALRESSALFEGVLENTTDPIFVKDLKGRYVTVNTAAAQVFGRPRHEVVGLDDSSLFPSEAADRIVEDDRRIMRTGRHETTEEKLFDLSRGDSRIFSTAKTPLRDGEGKIIGLIGVARDVTVQRQAEVAVRASEERFRAFVEHAPQLMWVNRVNGIIEFFNAAWRAYTGHNTVESTRWTILHPDDREHVRDVSERAIRAGEPYEYEMRLRRADGVYRWHLCRVSPMRQDGRIVAWIGTAVDVDDIRHAQEAAENADRSKGRFLAAASHDLRQPMQSILLFAEALRPFVEEEEGRRRLTRLLESLDTLKGLLDSLLDISRLDADIVRPQIEAFPIMDVLSPLSAAYAPAAEAKGLEWHIEPCNGLVLSDRILLGRMLRNLIENAVRYTENGRIVIACTQREETLHVEVRDTGIGIPTEHADRIWEEFHQVGNPERDRALGLGLGLAIVRRLSMLLGHPVSGASRPGDGSVFSIDVPLAATEPAASEPGEPEMATDGPNRQLVLVVDDETTVLLGLRTILEEWGYAVIVATSTDQAIERLQTSGRRPDLMLVDYRLREGRIGTETARRVREMFDADVPGLIVTGEIGVEPQRDAALLGLGLLHKPVMPRVLRGALDHHLHKNREPGRMKPAEPR